MHPLPQLPIETVQRSYTAASHRFILLGFDGTLVQQDKVIQHLKNFQASSAHFRPSAGCAFVLTFQQVT